MTPAYAHNAPILMTPSMNSWGTKSASTNLSQGDTPYAIVNDDTNEVSLGIIDAAFGLNADLYRDTLGVAPEGTSEQIQDAYFDQRNELFRLLGEIDTLEFVNTSPRDTLRIREQYRYETERKLDALVGAVRILRDPELRLQYDEIRRIRLGRTNPPSNQQNLPQYRPTVQQQPPHQAIQRNVNVTPGLVSLSNSRIVTPPKVVSPPQRKEQKLRLETPSPIPTSRQPSPVNRTDRSSPSSQRFASPPSPGTQNLAVARASPKTVRESPRKVEPIVRDSNYVGALMRANSLTSYPAPPQLPNYLDSSAKSLHQDVSIVSGLTNPTSLTNGSLAYSTSLTGFVNHHPSDKTTSTNGSSLEETIVSNSTMALNSYGPVQQPTDKRTNSGRNGMKSTDRRTGKSSDELPVVTPPSTRRNRPEQTSKSSRKLSETRSKLTDEQRKSTITFSFDDHRDMDSTGSVGRNSSKLYSSNTFDNQSIGLTTDNEDEEDCDTLSEHRHSAAIDDNRGLLDRIRSEVLGAIDDASRSLEDVLHVFTLRAEEIDAVVGRINKAQRQMSKSMQRGGLPKSPSRSRSLSVSGTRRSETSIAGNTADHRNKASNSKTGKAQKSDHSETRKAGRNASPKPRHSGRV